MAVLIDPLEVLRSLDPEATHLIRASLFPPLRSPLSSPPSSLTHPPHPPLPSSPVENERGLCAWVEETHAALTAEHATFCASWRLEGSSSDLPVLPAVPPLAALVHKQRYSHQTLAHARCARGGTIAPPLLFCSLLHNQEQEDLLIHALGCLWVVPAAAAFCLAPLSRWVELPALRPTGGYRLILVDPPWRSHSVRRKGHYSTLDDNEILSQVV